MIGRPRRSTILYAPTAVAAACALGVVTAPQAGPLRTDALSSQTTASFYNHPDGTPDVHLRDTAFCTAFTASQMNGDIDRPEFTSPQAWLERQTYQGLVPDLLDLMSISTRTSSAARGLMDDCMVALGWRSFEIEGESQEAFNARFAGLTEAERNRWITGNPPPAGALKRVWRNSFWHGAESTDAIRPGIRPAIPQNQITFMGSRRPASLARTPMGPAEAVVVFQASHSAGFRGLRSATFQTADLETGLFAPAPNPGVPTRNYPSGRGGFTVSSNTRNVAANPNRGAMIVPAGTYALADITSNINQVPCFGTVGFTIQPGEVLVLGSFTFGPGPAAAPSERSFPTSIRRDAMTDEAVSAVLADYPDLLARARPATWLQDIRVPCMAWVPGVPPAFNWRLRWPEAQLSPSSEAGQSQQQEQSQADSRMANGSGSSVAYR